MKELHHEQQTLTYRWTWLRKPCTEKEQSVSGRTVPTQDKKLGKLNIPIQVISGDHHIVFPIENWYSLTRKMPNLQIIMVGQAGHGPQHQYPELIVSYISAFVELAEV